MSFPVFPRQSRRQCRRRPRRIHLRPQAISQPSGQKPRRQADQLEIRQQPTKPLTPAPVPASSSAMNSTAIPAVSKETTPAPRNVPPPVEQPKKSALGEVHLATPSVNRTANSTQGGEAPSIDGSQPSSGEPFAMSVSDSKEPTAPLPVGGDVVSAKLLKSVPPVYPPAARTQRVGGDVKIDALIDVSGNVSTMKVLSGPTMLHQAATNALKQWKYEPAKLDGNPTPHAFDRYRAVPLAITTATHILN